MARLRVDARRLRAGRLVPPVSKSHALRALCLRGAVGLPADDALVGARPWPTDVEAMAEGLARIASGATAEIDCRDGGAPLRFLVARAAITPGHFRFVGSPRLGARPHGPMLESLRRALGPSGLSIDVGRPWPIDVHGTGLTGEPRFRVSGGRSSQYASSLLLAAAALTYRERRPWTVALEGTLASAGYLELTLAALSGAGFEIRRTGDELRVEGFTPRDDWRPVPRDWSSLGYLLVIAWATRGSVESVDLNVTHPDRAIVEHLASVGLELKSDGGGDTHVVGAVSGGLRASAQHCPDLIPTLVALACVLPAPSTFTDLAILRDKESDRLTAICELAAAGGAATVLEGDTLVVNPGARRPVRATFCARGDHRLTLASATLAVCLGAVLELEQVEGVEKSFPGFFETLQTSGVVVAHLP